MRRRRWVTAASVAVALAALAAFTRRELDKPWPSLYLDDDTADTAPLRVCLLCGCTDDHACPGGCWWFEVDLGPNDASLCSRCADILRERLEQLDAQVSE